MRSLINRFRLWLFARNVRRVEILTLKPGDTLVLYVDRMLTAQQVEAIGQVLRTKFPSTNSVVIDGGMRLGVVRSNGTEAGHA